MAAKQNLRRTISRASAVSCTPRLVYSGQVMNTPRPDQTRIAKRVHLWVLGIMQAIMAAELAFLVMEGRWMHVFLITMVMGVMLAPLLAGARMGVVIPSEIQLLAIAFIFAAIFLGEIHNYYARIWWWDLALHGTAGLLLGLLGFLIVYILNENARVDVQLRPSFVALFAFFFSLGLGTLWEIFEFAMDSLFGTTMQKPMFGDASGLTDTMWDLIVDAVGAAVISISGWLYLRKERRHWLDGWVLSFIEGNPGLFKNRG